MVHDLHKNEEWCHNDLLCFICIYGCMHCHLPSTYIITTVSKKILIDSIKNSMLQTLRPCLLTSHCCPFWLRMHADTGLFKGSSLPSWLAWCPGFASMQGWMKAWSAQPLIQFDLSPCHVLLFNVVWKTVWTFVNLFLHLAVSFPSHHICAFKQCSYLVLIGKFWTLFWFF
jgi:hypothetical protein